MDLVLVGYGRMGQIIHSQAQDRGHFIIDILDPSKGTIKNIEKLKKIKFDVLIDFSVPSIAMKNIEFYAKHNIKAVVGTTGWYDDIEEVKKLFSNSSGAILWASNFSIGVNLFWEILKKASQIMDRVEDYDVFGHEFHHKAKIDSPSGTAISTASCVINNMTRKNKLVTERLDRAPLEDELHFSSTRGGSVPGTHSIYFDSPFDTIELKHTARSRNGFALGSVLAAEWLNDKTGYFEVKDWVSDLIK